MSRFLPDCARKLPPGNLFWEVVPGLVYPQNWKTLAESTDPKVITEATRKAHERLVDNPPWLYIVHDLNPRAMSGKVKGFVSPQSWFLDMTTVSMQ